MRVVEALSALSGARPAVSEPDQSVAVKRYRSPGQVEGAQNSRMIGRHSNEQNCRHNQPGRRNDVFLEGTPGDRDAHNDQDEAKVTKLNMRFFVPDYSGLPLSQTLLVFLGGGHNLEDISGWKTLGITEPIVGRSQIRPLPELEKYFAAIIASNLLLIPFLSLRHGICLCTTFSILQLWQDHLPCVLRRTFMTEVNKQADASGGDEAERERLLVEQLPQVRYIARRIHDRLPRHVLLEDLVHAGVVGLIDALQKFDGSKQVQFGSYAKFRIRGAILDSLRELDWSPRDLRRKARRLEEAHNQLRSSLGRNPASQNWRRSWALICAAYNCCWERFPASRSAACESSLRGTAAKKTYANTCPTIRKRRRCFLCLRSEMKDLLTRAIAELPEKEQQVLALYYYEELTMKEVGVILGVGESRVSQIHSMAVIRLRTRLAESGNGHAGPQFSRGASGGSVMRLRAWVACVGTGQKKGS